MQLIFEPGEICDTSGNQSAATTITFSKSAIASNTGNYENKLGYRKFKWERNYIA